MATDDGEDMVSGLARKVRGGSDDEESEDKDMESGSYDKILDSAAEGIISAVNDGDRGALRDELWDFVKACIKKGKE